MVRTFPPSIHGLEPKRSEDRHRQPHATSLEVVPIHRGLVKKASEGWLLPGFTIDQTIPNHWCVGLGKICIAFTFSGIYPLYR